MARERGLYQRDDSPYWWIDVVLPDGRRVRKSTRHRGLEQAKEYLVRLKAETYEAVRYGFQLDHDWQDAVVRYVKENGDKRSLPNDKRCLRQLDPYLKNKKLSQINMDVLWLFIDNRRDNDGVTNATINRALEIVRLILYLARDEWQWLQRFPKIRMLKVPKRRVRFITREEATALLEAFDFMTCAIPGQVGTWRTEPAYRS